MLNIIDTHIKNAMLSKDTVALEALRSFKTMLVNESKNTNGVINEAQFNTVLQKTIKQRKDSIQLFKESNRVDLVEKETLQLEVLERFQPKQLTLDELTDLVRPIKETLNLSEFSPKSSGMIIGAFNKTHPDLKGKFDIELLKTAITSLF